MNYDFFKVACVSPDLVVADCFYNAEQIILNVKNANKKGASLIVFPELSITGFSCGDLFFQKTLQNQAIQLQNLFLNQKKLHLYLMFRSLFLLLVSQLLQPDLILQSLLQL